LHIVRPYAKIVTFMRPRCETRSNSNLSCVVNFVVGRGVAQELTRHGKTLAFQRESPQHFANSNGEFRSSVGFVRPRGLAKEHDDWWKKSLRYAEAKYFAGLALGLKPHIAADVLPHSTATILTAVGNLRSWRHFLSALPSGNGAGHHDEQEISLSVDAATVLAPLQSVFKGTFPDQFDFALQT